MTKPIKPIISLYINQNRYGEIQFKFSYDTTGGYQKQKLDGKEVHMLIKRLKLDLAETWAECWRDDDSPQAEITFGVRRQCIASVSME